MDRIDVAPEGPLWGTPFSTAVAPFIARHVAASDFSAHSKQLDQFSSTLFFLHIRIVGSCA